MIKEFEDICDELDQLIREWEIKLGALTHKTYSLRRNSQNRSIRQIVGHMVKALLDLSFERENHAPGNESGLFLAF